MNKQPQGPKSERARSYGRPPNPRVGAFMTYLAPDAAAAVLELTKTENLSRSGAIHHLVRLGAGLPSLYPLD